MFVRVKKIKGKPYAYLVENEWTPWGSRQRVTKYLGKTSTLTRFSEGLLDLPTGLQEAILEAAAQELVNHGFAREGTILKQEDITVDLQEKTVRQKGKKIVLGMNEGYLCDHTLQQLLTFTPEERPDESAKKLASLALEAGLKLSNEQFVHLFEQVK
ncbi:Uncharacterised protein [uncultured archaeon]|nr:Uncharacterised protein [uncultured archaeon]